MNSSTNIKKHVQRGGESIRREENWLSSFIFLKALPIYKNPWEMRRIDYLVLILQHNQFSQINREKRMVLYFCRIDFWPLYPFSPATHHLPRQKKKKSRSRITREDSQFWKTANMETLKEQIVIAYHVTWLFALCSSLEQRRPRCKSYKAVRTIFFRSIDSDDPLTSCSFLA